MENLAERLKYSREQMKMNQDEVAGLLGISRKSIINHESGANRPSAALLKRYAALYQVPWDWLLTGKVTVDGVGEPLPKSAYLRAAPAQYGFDETMLVEAFRLLDETERYSILLDVFHSLAEKRNREHDQAKKAQLNRIVEALKKEI